MDLANPDRLLVSTVNTYASQDGGWGDQILQSTNGGSSWTSQTIRRDVNGVPWIDGNAIHWAGSLEFDPFNTNCAFVTSGNGIFMTENVNASPTVWKFLTKGLEETVPLDAVSIPGTSLISVIGERGLFKVELLNSLKSSYSQLSLQGMY